MYVQMIDMVNSYEPDRAKCAGEGEQVDLAEAPVLKSLLWTGRERTSIPADEAFRHYETNWRFIKDTPMGAAEKRLLERLKKDYGRGLING